MIRRSSAKLRGPYARRSGLRSDKSENSASLADHWKRTRIFFLGKISTEFRCTLNSFLSVVSNVALLYSADSDIESVENFDAPPQTSVCRVSYSTASRFCASTEFVALHIARHIDMSEGLELGLFASDVTSAAVVAAATPWKVDRLQERTSRGAYLCNAIVAIATPPTANRVRVFRLFAARAASLTSKLQQNAASPYVVALSNHLLKLEVIVDSKEETLITAQVTSPLPRADEPSHDPPISSHQRKVLASVLKLIEEGKDQRFVPVLTHDTITVLRLDATHSACCLRAEVDLHVGLDEFVSMFLPTTESKPALFWGRSVELCEQINRSDFGDVVYLSFHTPAGGATSRDSVLLTQRVTLTVSGVAEEQLPLNGRTFIFNAVTTTFPQKPPRPNCVRVGYSVNAWVAVETNVQCVRLIRYVQPDEPTAQPMQQKLAAEIVEQVSAISRYGLTTKANYSIYVQSQAYYGLVK